MLSTLAFAGMIATTWGHGRLTKPMTRAGHTGYENDPIGFGGRPERQYICRHDNPNPSVTPAEFTVGEKMTVQWVTTAPHVGDCSLYMSYDTDAPTLEDMRWFKIANKKQCRSVSGEDVQFDLPPWLPTGDAVLRWEWSALHVTPTIEFYAQCADIKINNPNGNAIPKASIPTFKIFENGVKTSLPVNANRGVGFRFPFGTDDLDDPSQFMTGPECALNSQLNECDLTAEGTLGWVELEKSNTSPVTTPTSPPVPLPTMEPVASPTQPPVVQPPVTSPTQPPVVQPPVVSPTQPPVVQPPVVSPTQPPVVSPTEQPGPSPTSPPVVDGECTSPLYQAYEQCAGDNWAGAQDNSNGCPVCPSGYQCYQRSNWYSNCNHSCPQGLGWDCDNSLPAPTPTPAESCNAEWETCGGENFPIGDAWNGSTCCQEGLECVVLSQWYSQCRRV